MSTDTLYDFHRFIQSNLDFDDSQMAAFIAVDRKGKQRQYSLFDTGDGAMDTIDLESLVKGKYKQLRYMFDFFHQRSLIIELLGEAERLPRRSYPLVFEAKGDGPDQFEERPLPDPLPEIKTDEELERELEQELALALDDDSLDDPEDDMPEEDGYDVSDLSLLEETRQA